MWECDSVLLSEAGRARPSESRLKGIDCSEKHSERDVHRRKKLYTALFPLVKDAEPQKHIIQWYRLVIEYSHRQLTYEKDKLPAIQGLADSMSREIGGDYMAGLWSHDLHRGLL
jgi:hypothetical protein